MGESLISVAVASEFVKEELSSLEDAELRESLHLGESSIGDLPVPGGFGGTARPGMTRRQSDEEDEAAEVTMLAGLIERILARLTVNMKGFTLRLVIDDDNSGQTEVEVRIAELSYADEKAGGGGEIEQGRVTVVRSVKIAPPQVLLRTPAPPANASRSSSSDSSSSTASADSTSSEDESVSADHDMMMSQSIADLRTSLVSTSSGAGSSMYASARGGMSSAEVGSRVGGHDSSSDEDSPFLDPEAQVQIDPAESAHDQEPAQEEQGNDFRLVLSFGHEPLVITLSSSKSTPAAPPPPSANAPRAAAAPSRRRLSELSVQSTVAGPVTLLLVPHQLQSLLRLGSALVSSSPRPPPPPPPSNPTPRRPSSSSLTVAVNLKAFNIVLVYASQPSTSSLTSFWSHPSTVALPQNHLRLRLEGLGAWIVRSPTEAPQTVFPLRSYLLTESVKLDGEVRTLPILVSDPNLAKQYDLTGSKMDFPSFDSVDWLENAAAEGRGWKVKLKARKRGSTGTRPETPQTPTRPVAAVTLTLDDGQSELSGPA